MNKSASNNNSVTKDTVMLEKSTNKTKPSKQTYAYSILVISICALFLFYKYVLQVFPSIMTTELMSKFNLQGVGMGNLAATFSYSFFITQLFVGVLIDKFGVRYLCTLALAVGSLGAYLFFDANTLVFACFARALMGAGMAFATVCYLKSAAVWFKPKHYALVSGLLATAAMSGAFFSEAPLSFVQLHFGWQKTIEICAYIGFAITVIFFVFVKNKPKKSFIQNNTYKSQSESKSNIISLKDIWAILKMPQNWLLTFYSGLAFSPVAVFGGLWGNPFLQASYNLSKTTTATLVSMCFVGLAVGGPVLGWISDKLEARKKVMLFSNLLSLFCLTIVLYDNTLSPITIGLLLFLFGFGIGAFMLGFVVAKEINPIVMAATVIALVNTGDAIFEMFTEPMIGYFLDLTHRSESLIKTHQFSVSGFHYAFAILPVYLVLSTILLIFIKTKNKND